MSGVRVIRVANYNVETGELLQIVAYPEPMISTGLSLAREGCANVILPDEFTGMTPDYYVADGIALERQPMPVTVAGTVISGIPLPATITIAANHLEDDQQTFDVPTSTLELDLDEGGGAHKVTIRGPSRYLKWAGLITS